MSWRDNVLLILFIASSSLFYSCTDRVPKIVFESNTYDLGVIKENDSVKVWSVPFVNKGGGELSIDEIRTDCDCTTTQFPRKKYKRGEGGNIQIRVDLSGFLPGKYKKKVGVYTNAKNNPEVIMIYGQINGH